MNIAVFGLGYVGVVSAACLARDGHVVIGVDSNRDKVRIVNRGFSPVVEPGLDELIADAVAQRRLSATDDHGAAVREAELILVCVGTPGHANGSLDLSYVRRVCEQIGEHLLETAHYKVVVIRSTMLPGSMDCVVASALEAASGGKAGEDFGLCINPEFLREGSAIFDYDHPPKTVVGASDSRAVEVVQELYGAFDAPMLVTDVRTAEMMKYADNSWHALKITFANEISRLCKALSIDSRHLMELFCRDLKLNISPAYLRPGFAFGGSCLPKDLRAITYQGKLLDVETPVLSAILDSNQRQVDTAYQLVRASGSKRIGLLGLSFKEGTDDLRESPVVALAEQLIGKGYELRVFDRNVRLSSLIGANREYIFHHIPHIGRVLVDDADSLLAESDVIVLATGEKEFGEILERKGRDKHVIDLVGIWGRAAERGHYEGIGW